MISGRKIFEKLRDGRGMDSGVIGITSALGSGELNYDKVLIFTFFIGKSSCVLGQVWCLIVSIPDLCPLSYLNY